CICVLLLSSKPYLSKEEAARSLRYVPWAERGRRHIPPGHGGAFAEEELAVRNDVKEPRLTLPNAKDGLAEIIVFGGNADGQNRASVTLANRVRDFYRKVGLAHLHEIRVSEEASGRLRDGLYQLFWNNQAANEKAPSDEMALLLQKFARPRRENLGELWEQQ